MSKRLTLNELDMLNHLENFDMIDNMLLDLTIHKLNQRGLFKDPLRSWRNWLAMGA